MIAAYLAWAPPADDIERRIASSLGQFGVWRAQTARVGQAVLASAISPAPDAVSAGRRAAVRLTAGPAGRRAAQRRGAGQGAGSPGSDWRPARGASGRQVLFCGWLDNARALAAELGSDPLDCAATYAAALDRWGDGAEARAIGEYCTISLEPDGDGLRLARSPWTAPPLHYFVSERGAAAATVLRVLHACGHPRVLNRAKLADSLYFNLTETEGWYEGCYEVKTGSVVHLTRAGARINQWYDHLAVREPVRMARPEDYVEAVDALLNEVIGETLRYSRRPCTQLSGGLDSSNVTARVLRALGPGARLDSFTFLPHPDWDDGALPARFYKREKAKVDAFAAMHPGLDAHFSDNAEADFDDCTERMFKAMDFAPVSLPNQAPLHALFAKARDRGCDLMIGAGHGNFNFSSAGDWGFCEYLLRGRWIQLYRALKHVRGRTCSLPRALFSFSLKPLLPAGLQWRIANRYGLADTREDLELTPIQHEWRDKHDMVSRARKTRYFEEIPSRRSRAHMLAEMFGRGEMNGGDINLGFEQLYGVRFRDVTAYRPLMELCLAAPTDLFLRDGTERWMARELGRGLLPDAIRLERNFGQPLSDWHLRLSRSLPRIRAELDAAEADPVLADIVDFDALRRRIDSFPEEETFDYRTLIQYPMGLPRAVMAARFARFVSGRNEG